MFSIKRHLTLPALLRIKKAVKHPKTIDLGLIAVHPDYQGKGVNAVFLAKMMSLLDDVVEWLETNLNLETNEPAIAQRKSFNAINHKRRRIYAKELEILRFLSPYDHGKWITTMIY